MFNPYSLADATMSDFYQDHSSFPFGSLGIVVMIICVIVVVAKNSKQKPK